MHQKLKSNSSQNGNILFLILLAVVLFAALSYAVTSSMRGGGNDASSEKHRIFATQLIENANLIENNVLRASMIDNIPNYGFNFSGSGSRASSNATCLQQSCKIYSTNGGGVPELVLPAGGLSSSNNGTSETKAVFVVVAIANVGTALQDLTIHYNKISRDLCQSINYVLGINDIDLDDITEAYGEFTTYSGTLTSFPTSAGLIGETLTSLAGKRSFCFHHTSIGYTFVSVIIPR